MGRVSGPIAARLAGWRRRRREERRRRMRVRKVQRRFGVSPRDPETRDYVAEIDAFWRRHFGRAVDPSWHLAFAKLGLDRDPRFVPSHEWWSEILPFLNDRSARPVYRDKNLSDVLLDRGRAPRTLLKRMRGGYWDGEGRPVSRAEAERRLVRGPEPLIVKPARADNGIGVRRFDPDGGALRDGDALLGLAEIEAAWRGDFIVQERIRQHPSFAAVHPASVNTLRIVTLRFAGELHPLLGFARFGTGGKVTDNAATGGLLCRVEDDGRLADHAVDLDGNAIEKHPDTGYAFSQRLAVPGWPAFVREALRLHEQIFHFDVVSWDFAVGEDGGPVFLEMNFQGVCEAYQRVGRRPLFGRFTEGVLEAVRDARTRGRR